MRRTLAIAGTATLAVAGWAGPATADAAGITQHQDIAAVEVAVGLVDAGPSNDIDEDYMVIRNFETFEAELDEYEVKGCDASGEFQIVAFGPDDEIPESEFFLLADNNYAGAVVPDLQTDMSGLSQTSNQGLFLLDTNSTPDEVVNGTWWGGASAPSGCPSGLDPANNDPTDDDSLHDQGNDTWDHGVPNPRNTTS